MASAGLLGMLFATAVSNLLITKNWVKQTSKQTDNIRTTLQTFTSTIDQLPDQLHYFYASIYGWFNRLSLFFFFFFTFFHAVSSLSKDCLTQSSSALSPFDPFLAIDRSYTTCFRSKKVRNSKCKDVPEMKRNRRGRELELGTFGLRDQRRKQLGLTFSWQSPQTHHSLSNMNANGWIIAWDDGAGVSAFLFPRFVFLPLY